MNYFLIAFALMFLYWANTEWQCSYYVGEDLVDWRKYNTKSIFFKPFRKIYRPKKYAKDGLEFDIFVLEKSNRITKHNIYYLADLDDNPEITQQLKENHNG